jgi:hypothetical protein
MRPPALTLYSPGQYSPATWPWRASTPRLARELGLRLDRPWLVNAGSVYLLWEELAWLHPFMVRALGVEEVRRIYKAAEGEPLPGYVKYMHASTMFKLTGEAEYAEKALRYGEEAYRSFDSPLARARVASLLVAAARRLGDARSEGVWLSRLVENAPGPLSSADYAEALSRARRVYSKTRDARLYLDILSSLARRAAAERKLEELDVVLSEVESLMLSGGGDQRLAEAYYFTIDALKRATLGDWTGAERSLTYALSTGSAPPSAHLMAAVARLFHGDVEGARRAAMQGSLDPQDREYLRALERFMASEEPPRSLARHPGDARIALLEALARAARGLEARSPDPEAQPIVSALRAAAQGKPGEVHREMSPLLEDTGYTPLHLLADAMATVAQAKSDPEARRPAASVLRRMAESAEAAGNKPLAMMLRELAASVEEARWGKALQTLAKLSLYTIYTVS